LIDDYVATPDVFMFGQQGGFFRQFHWRRVTQNVLYFKISIPGVTLSQAAGERQAVNTCPMGKIKDTGAGLPGLVGILFYFRYLANVTLCVFARGSCLFNELFGRPFQQRPMLVGEVFAKKRISVRTAIPGVYGYPFVSVIYFYFFPIINELEFLTYQGMGYAVV
jgi:hypothetical protein